GALNTRLLSGDFHGGDILIHAEGVGECVHAFLAPQSRLPDRLAGAVAESIWQTLVKTRRNLHVHITAEGSVGNEMVSVGSAIRRAIISGAGGHVALPVPGYSATLAELS